MRLLEIPRRSSRHAVCCGNARMLWFDPMSAAAKHVDRTFYPVEEHLGESVLHMRIRMLLWQLLSRWLEGKRAFAGSDQFIYWRRGDPKSCVSPDAYVMPGIDPRAFPENWKIWETGIVPSFAIEIVSRSWKKDYRRAPERYAALGVSELVIFDPDYAERAGRWRWRVWRREEGRLELVEQTNLDRVRSKTLRCW